MPRPMNTLLDFYRRIRVTDSCWEWTGYVNKEGYGHFSGWGFGLRKPENAHRFAYKIAIGDLLPGMHIDHLCRNRRCVKPAHLEQVTPRENTLRGIGPSALNTAKRACPRGHRFTGANLYINPRGDRECRTCRSESARRYRQAPKGVKGVS